MKSANENRVMARPRRVALLPGLRSAPWWNPAEIPAAALLEENYAEIRDEFLNVLLCGLLRLHPQSMGGPSKQVADGNWNIFELFSRGCVSRQNAVLAPRTISVLRQLPDVTTHPSGFAYFSVLGPHVHIAAHRGPVSSRIRVHLGLRVPPGAVMRVGRETRSWAEGACSVFDDSWEHEVFNKSDCFRAVLLVDVWHPDLTAQQRSKLVSHASLRERYDEKRRKGRKGWIDLRSTDAVAPPLSSLVGTRHLGRMAASAAKTCSSPHQSLATLRTFASESMDGTGAVPGARSSAAARSVCDDLWAALASLATGRPADVSVDDMVNIIHLGCAWWRSWPGNERSLWKFMKGAEPDAPPLNMSARCHGVRDVLQRCNAYGETVPFGVVAASAVVAIRAARPLGLARART